MVKRSSGQEARKKRDRNEQDGDGGEADVSVSGGAAAFNDGSLDKEYAGMSMTRAVNHIREKYGDVTIPKGSKYLTGETGLDVVKAVDGIMSDFAPLFEDGATIGVVNDSRGSWLAHAKVGEVLFGKKNGVVEFNRRYLNATDHSNEWYKGFSSTERGGFHFPNNTSGAVAAHELGHMVDAALTRRAAGTSDPGWAAASSWNSGTVAGDIIHAAARGLGLTSGSSWTTDGISAMGKSHISGYAGTDVHETLAEAFGDVFANGSSAAPLSRAIYNEAKKRVARL